VGVEWSAKLALAFNVVLELKKQAGPDNNGHAYICPEPAAHGEAWALIAEVYNVNGVQAGLF
jgi:hypothetical protein